MLLKCDVCGCEFDHRRAGKCDCGYGCGGGTVKCPQCGIHVDLPPEIYDKAKNAFDDNTLYARLEREFNMDK
ncbi:hypothetical protein [Methanosphaera sp.]